MVYLTPHLSSNGQIRKLRISVPLVDCLVDGVRYFRPDDLPPATGNDLMPLYRPTLQPRKPRPNRRRFPAREH